MALSPRCRHPAVLDFFLICTIQSVIDSTRFKCWWQMFVHIGKMLRMAGRPAESTSKHTSLEPEWMHLLSAAINKSTTHSQIHTHTFMATLKTEKNGLQLVVIICINECNERRGRNAYMNEWMDMKGNQFKSAKCQFGFFTSFHSRQSNACFATHP